MSSAPVRTSPQPRYQRGTLLGRGGMAEVHAGVDAWLGRPVAIKRLREELAADPTVRARFRREAAAAARLNHHGIVAVFDAVQEESRAGGTTVPIIVMELVDGRSLRDVLRDGVRVDPDRALSIAGDVLEALAASHAAGIVHRDIKPGNVLVTSTGEVKVADFGIARSVCDVSATMTQTATVLGTAHYMSPEQARGLPVDQRSDLYSVGCLLFELLAGRPPFTGDSALSVAFQHVAEPPSAPSSHDPRIGPDVDAIVLTALAKDPADRYHSAREMRAAIEQVRAGRALPVGPTIAPPAPVRHDGPGDPARAGTMTRPRSARWLLAAALLLTGGLVSVVSVPTLGGAPPTAQLPSLTHRSPERAEARIPRNLLGHPLDQVRTTLAEAGFTRVVARPAAGSTGGELGTVTAVDPGEGRTVPVTSAVILTYVTWTKPSPSRGSDTARSSAASHSPDSPARNADEPTPRRSGRQDPAAAKEPPGQSSTPPEHSAARGNSSAEKHRHRPASGKKAPNSSSEKRRN